MNWELRITNWIDNDELLRSQFVSDQLLKTKDLTQPSFIIRNCKFLINSSLGVVL
jgi:hypothetical protein